MHPGGRWSGLYHIVCLADFEELLLLRGLEDCGHIIYPQDVHRVEIPADWDYPLRERFVRENTTLAGRISAKECVDDVGDLSDHEREAANPYLLRLHSPVVPRFHLKPSEVHRRDGDSDYATQGPETREPGLPRQYLPVPAPQGPNGWTS